MKGYNYMRSPSNHKDKTTVLSVNTEEHTGIKKH